MMMNKLCKSVVVCLRKKIVLGVVVLISSSPTFALDVVGIHSHFNRYPESSDTYLTMIKQYGFTAFRSDLAWNSIEKKKGVFSIDADGNKKEDQALQEGLLKYNLNALMVVGYGNQLYSANGIDYPRTADAIAAFANYAGWVAARYKGKVKYYDIWNEWLYGTGVKSNLGVPPPEVYFQLVKAASIAIRKANPDAVVLAGSFNTNIPRDVNWFDGLMKMGILEYIDGVSIHPYSIRLPEDNLAAIDKFETLAKKYAGKEVPIYITEVGNSSYTGVGHVSDDAAAQFVIKYTFLAKTRSYIKGLWWYDLIDDGANPNNRENRYGFVTQTKQPKPSALQLQKLSEVIKNYNVEHYQVGNDGKVQISLSYKGQHAMIYWQQEPVVAQVMKKDFVKSVKSFMKMEDDKSEGPIRMIDQNLNGQPLYEEKSMPSTNYGNTPVLVLSDEPIKTSP
ncbi:hypothetical protein HL670_03589 [Serratia plymuthica]|uniref:cellulase family glycosylhydrolase n=1 Tax=Serratia plymuthica TaxID=82996 RepID=UPI00034BF462|nr:cellulase family glycosylhydrolase [Serratia plymuthica]QJW56692.1 hypothetical protein HL670_03589 [Serratia plymuthica]